MKKSQDEESIWSIDLGDARRGAGASATFVRIAASLVNDIRRGALGAGDKLPSTRALADRLGVNRNTIVAAFDELGAEGWVVTRGSAGTFVCDEVPERSARRGRVPRGLATRPGFALRTIRPEVGIHAAPPPSPGPTDVRYQLSAGVPDTRLLPTTLLARAYRRALRAPSARLALDYADAFGAMRLRTAIAGMLRATRGIPADPANVLITRGSQMALDLIARALLRPGEHALVEELGYQPAWHALAEAGARLIPVSLDSAGLVVGELARHEARCLYTTPHHQYPTTVVLSPARRSALLAHARERGLAIIEDDYDHEFHFDGRPVAPLAAADRGANVIYVGTLSKTLAPGLRLGFVAAPRSAIAELTKLRAISDRQGDQVLENAVAELMEDGEIARHVRKMRRVYGARRAALASAVQRDLGDVLSFQLPPGGITLWARVAEGISVDAWQKAALARGVSLATARQFDIAGRSSPFVRLAFARHDETELTDAVRRLRRALADVRR